MTHQNVRTFFVLLDYFGASVENFVRITRLLTSLFNFIESSDNFTISLNKLLLVLNEHIQF